MKQGKIKSLIDTGQEFGDKVKYNVSTYEGDNGIIWISKNPQWQCKVGDVIQYHHKRDNTTYKDLPKFDNWKKLKKVEKPMHGNYKPNNNFGKETYISAEEDKQNRISFANKLNVVAQLYSGKGDQISLDQVFDKAEHLYNKEKNFFN
tara:strand:+ start:314 stop:757 length:444 start_codon:yes stop_codon:yes gene_type:complete